MEQIQKRLSYANVMATLAVFIALGGISWAAVALPANSVGTKQLKRSSVGTAQLKKASVDTSRLRNGAVGPAKLKEGSVGAIALQGNAVGYDQLAPLSVDGEKVKDGTIGYENLDSLTVSPRLFAHVSSSGILAEQAGVESAGNTSAGQYFVRFNRSLHGCVGVASVGFGFGPGVIGAGATAQVRMNLDNDPNRVGITIYRGGYTFGNVENNDFHLVIAC